MMIMMLMRMMKMKENVRKLSGQLVPKNALHPLTKCAGLLRRKGWIK